MTFTQSTFRQEYLPPAPYHHHGPPHSHPPQRQMIAEHPPYSAPPFQPFYPYHQPHLAHDQQRMVTHQRHLSEAELNIKPRPHPHLPSATVYLDHIPQDVEETIFVKALRECMPMRIKLNETVPSNNRIQPDAYYEWMPKSGTLVFEDMYHVEKALAILSSHPLVYSRGIVVSPYQPPFLPPLSEAPGRHLRPKRQVSASNTTSSDPNEQFMQQCPTPGELFDAVRTWGTVRSIAVWQEEQTPQPSAVWGARIEFWYEDEARRFEVGFGQTGDHIKGWQVEVHPEILYSAPPPLDPSLRNMPYPHGPLPPNTDFPMFAGNTAGNFSEAPVNLPPLHFDPIAAVDQPMHLPPMIPDSTVPSTPVGRGHRHHLSNSLPQTPPPMSFIPPWNGHNPHTVHGVDFPPAMAHMSRSPPHMGFGLPSSPGTPASANGNKSHVRHRSNSSRTSGSSFRQGRQRTWSVTIDEGPMGEVRPTGLIADDGTVIQHGPGQHIRPAPQYGPGSTSSSGLVDYSNVFVKNLDPDINSVFLSEFFAPIGRIVSARVMRDEQNRSRGYGFVSFHTPEEAMAAISFMNGQKLGKQFIAVTLHEPRKLRPEKIAERMAQGAPTAYGRQAIGTRRSSSPARVDRRQRHSHDEWKPPATTDDIRLLSPKSRKLALSRRVTPVVTRYARLHSVPEGYCQTTIKSLVDNDLQLIPLLYDPSALNAKISETMSVLQGDPELDINLGVSRPQRLHPPTRGEVEKIRFEVERIDPTNVDALMPILMRDLKGNDIQLCLGVKPALIQRYNAAKRELKEQKDQEEDFANPEHIPLPPSDPPSGTPPPFHRMPVEEATLAGFVALSSRDIWANLDGDDGDELLAKLGICRPVPQVLSGVESWTRKVMEKHGVERKVAMAGMLAKQLDVTMKRSVKTKIARDIVNDESDDEALCLLMAYPEVLEAKAKEYDASRE